MSFWDDTEPIASSEVGCSFWDDSPEAQEEEAARKLQEANIRMLAILQRQEEEHFLQVSTAKEVILPPPASVINIVTVKSINQMAFIDRIEQEEGIERLVTFVFSINQYAERRLLEYINRCKETTILYSIFKVGNVGERENFFNRTLCNLKRDGLTVKRAYSHAKISAMETKQGNYYVLNGSGNFTANTRIENYTLTNSKCFFEQLNHFIKDLP